jgi:hypothetical protein
LPRLQSATFESHRFSPVGPGILVENLVEFTGPGVKAAIAGDTGAGTMLGAMTSAPSISISREVTNRSEDLVGLNAIGKGSQVLQTTEVVMEAELVELTPEQLMRVHPGLAKSDWINDVHGKITAGTGNAALSVWSIVPGVAGNSTTFAISTPSGSGAISVTYTAPDVVVAPPTGATAQEVVDAINATASLEEVVQAGLPATSDGTGAVAAFTEAPLAGGAAGSRIGYKLDPTGFFKSSNYSRNLVLCLEGDNQDLLHIWRIDNAFQTDDLDISPDDAGGITSVSCSWTGHVTAANYDDTLGVYLPPYGIYVSDLAASA